LQSKSGGEGDALQTPNKIPGYNEGSRGFKKVIKWTGKKKQDKVRVAEKDKGGPDALKSRSAAVQRRTDRNTSSKLNLNRGARSTKNNTGNRGKYL